jgi:hypothetical protein
MYSAEDLLSLLEAAVQVHSLLQILQHVLSTFSMLILGKGLSVVGSVYN